MSERYFERLDYSGDLAEPFGDISSAFELGDYGSYEPITVGYEDFNAKLTTSDGAYFVKLFAKERTDAECERYARVMQEVVHAGVNHPKLEQAQGKLIHTPSGTSLRAVVMEWLDGSKYFENERPDDTELGQVVEQAAKINTLEIEMSDDDFVYDSWAMNNFKTEFDKWQHILNDEDKALVESALEDFKAKDIESLPKAFVHGDLIRTNVMPTENGLYVFDFSVSNINPRVQELAVLLCDMFFDPNSEAESKRLYELLLSEYQKRIKLSEAEIEALPAYARAAHAMHVIGASRGQEQGDGGDENDMWWNLGRNGLKMSIYEGMA